MQIEIKSCYETGLPGVWFCNGIEFDWQSWLLCEIKWNSGNIVHHCICTDFHCNNFKKPGLAKNVTMAIWNPSYDDKYLEDVPLKKLFHWKPISLIRSEPDAVINMP